MAIRATPRAAALSAVLTIVILSVAACGGAERSAASYCRTYDEGFADIRRDYPELDHDTARSGNPLPALLSATSAYADIAALIGDMTKSAPDSIRTDTERVHATLTKQLGALEASAGAAASGDLPALFGHFAAGLASGITNNGAFQRMDRYVLKHCGEHMFAARRDAPSPTTAT